MNYLSRYIPYLLLAGFIAFRLFTEWQHHQAQQQYVQKWEHVISYVQSSMPLEGVLTRKSDGYVYLKVSDDYIHKLLPMLSLDKGFKEPPFFRSPEAPGAHISVFNVDEHVDPKAEIGKIYHFTPIGVKVVQPNQHEQFAILNVSSPELEALRQQYAKPSKLQKHDFHISLGKKEVHPNHHHQHMQQHQPQPFRHY